MIDQSLLTADCYPNYRITTKAYIVGAERSGATERRPTIQAQTDSEWEKASHRANLTVYVFRFRRGRTREGMGETFFFGVGEGDNFKYRDTVDLGMPISLDICWLEYPFWDK